MNKQQQVERFKQNFQQFIKPHKCQIHKKGLNLLCIDPGCQNRGLICSICLTINGNHRNHDAVQIAQYVQKCLTEINKEIVKDQVQDLLNRAHLLYDNLLVLLSTFIDSCSLIIKNYISQRAKLHQDKIKSISYSPTKKIIQCKFKSLSQANKMLSSLSNRFVSLQLDKSINQEGRTIQKANDYVNDLSYQVCFIGKQLRKFQVRIKQLLNNKSSSPLVLNYEPTFCHPTLLQNKQFIYIGEAKNQKPHGKGIGYDFVNEKILFGEFLSGNLDGFGQLYYLNGDNYLGQFKNNKKEGRGVYRWNGKQYNLYEGEFKKGKRNGKGTFWWQDQSKYCGQFLQGQQTGYGIFYRKGDLIEYEGQWLNGMYHGKGVQYFQNGQKYEGEFRQDKFHGKGILTKEKEIIKGSWTLNELTKVHNQ